MFSFFKKKKEKKYKWEPLASNIQSILKLFEYYIDIKAPICMLLIEYNGVQYEIGVTGDYSDEKGFFDIVYYLNYNVYEDYEAFKKSRHIENSPLEDLRGTVYIIADKECGEPGRAHPQLMESN